MYKLCVDIGGTFTDFVLINTESGTLYTTKVLSTPHSPDEAVITGTRRLLAQAGLDPTKVTSVTHATTLVTNALIERKGARTALLTTRGFRDILEIGNERSYDIYDIQIEMPAPLVPRARRREIDERIGPGGEVLLPLDEEQAREVLSALRDRHGVESVAVSLLHSYLSPVHEQTLARLIQEMIPEATISLSSEVLPEVREYPRTSTTVANAYVQPIMRRYLDRLSQRLESEGVRSKLHVMLSDGGLTSVETASRFPIRIIESGPAAGVLVARSYGELAGVDRVLAFDMGGTTAKASVILEGKLTRTTDFEAARLRWDRKGSGLPLRVPVTDLIEIGAGGGSLASVNALGLLQVGPESAGANPGPVCYGRGGTQPTVTDADLVLGYLDQNFFLGGEMVLDKAAAEDAIRIQIAEPLGISVEKAALGIHEVVNEQMARAAQIHLIERGLDARDFTLVAFGGAGPVHAYGLASRLNIGEVIYPPLAGVASALGIAWAPASFSLVRSLPAPLSATDLAQVGQLYADMEREALEIMAGAGLAAEQVTFHRSCDARYRGQGYEVEVPLPDRPFDSTLYSVIETNFAAVYRQLYHREIPNVELEILAWRLVVSGPLPSVTVPRLQSDGESQVKGYRPVFFPGLENPIQTPVYDRSRLTVGCTFSGPAIVEERESTVVIGPGARASMDAVGNLRVRLPRAVDQVETLRLLGREVLR